MSHSILSLLSLIILTLHAGGCSNTTTVTPVQPMEARGADIYLASSDAAGAALTWDELLALCDSADVVILGEQHDDEVGHRVQAAIVEDLCARRPGEVALAMEMLERDEQALVNDFLDDIIDTETFVKRTFSSSWGGEGMWPVFYQPAIDAAKDAGAPVIAANAPRRYVRLARTKGLQWLSQLDGDRQQYFDVPSRLDDGHYRERFWRVMSSLDPDEPTTPEDKLRPFDDKGLTSTFSSQQTWDATMAQSVVSAHTGSTRCVVLMIGQFHTNFKGGTYLQIEQRDPSLRILNICLQREDGGALRDADQDRADVVIYTGARPEDG